MKPNQKEIQSNVDKSFFVSILKWNLDEFQTAEVIWTDLKSLSCSNLVSKRRSTGNFVVVNHSYNVSPRNSPFCTKYHFNNCTRHLHLPQQIHYTLLCLTSTQGYVRKTTFISESWSIATISSTNRNNNRNMQFYIGFPLIWLIFHL